MTLYPRESSVFLRRHERLFLCIFILPFPNTPERRQADEQLLLITQTYLATNDFQEENYNAVISRLEPFLPTLQKINNKSLLITLESYLAISYRNIGINNKAIALYEELVTQQKTEPLTKESIVTIENLGQLYLYEKEYAKAEAILRDSIEKAREQHIDAHTATKNLGIVLLCQKKFTEAEALNLKALSEAETAYGKHSAQLIPYMQDLGLVYIAEKRYKDATAMYKQTLRLLDKGPAKYASITSYNNLGLVYHAQADFRRASRWYNKALNIAKEMGLNLNSPNNGRIVTHLREVKARKSPSFLWDS
jgi:tetratricopeptide (TPR) repeat protein